MLHGERGTNEKGCVMMMKKVGAFALGILLTIAGTCMASIPREECAIGGITLNSKPDQIRAIYGTPTHEWTKQFTGYRNIVTNLYMVYGDSFKMLLTDYHDDGNYYMHNIITTANNGLGTPSGLMVGDPLEKAVTLYGMPDKVIDVSTHRYTHYVSNQDLKAVGKGRKEAIYNNRFGGILIIKAKKDKIVSLEIQSTTE